jgi:hypothetical protein
MLMILGADLLRMVRGDIAIHSHLHPRRAEQHVHVRVHAPW